MKLNKFSIEFTRNRMLQYWLKKKHFFNKNEIYCYIQTIKSEYIQFVKKIGAHRANKKKKTSKNA